jgi:transposase
MNYQNKYKHSKIKLVFSSIHHSKELNAFLKQKEIILEYFPVYCPELNPIEHLWKDIKSYVKKIVIERGFIFKISCYRSAKRDYIDTFPLLFFKISYFNCKIK